MNESPEKSYEEKGSSRIEEMEKNAYAQVAEGFRQGGQAREQDIKEKPVFSSKGREWPVSSLEDYAVAYSEREIIDVIQIIEEARKNNDYFKEKAASRLLELLTAEKGVVLAHSALRRYHPDTAEKMEIEKPHLKQMFDSRWSKFEEFERN